MAPASGDGDPIPEAKWKISGTIQQNGKTLSGEGDAQVTRNITEKCKSVKYEDDPNSPALTGWQDAT